MRTTTSSSQILMFLKFMVYQKALFFFFGLFMCISLRGFAFSVFLEFFQRFAQNPSACFDDDHICLNVSVNLSPYLALWVWLNSLLLSLIWYVFVCLCVPINLLGKDYDFLACFYV